ALQLDGPVDLAPAILGDVGDVRDVVVAVHVQGSAGRRLDGRDLALDGGANARRVRSVDVDVKPFAAPRGGRGGQEGEKPEGAGSQSHRRAGARPRSDRSRGFAHPSWPSEERRIPAPGRRSFERPRAGRARAGVMTKRRLLITFLLGGAGLVALAAAAAASIS